MTDLTAILEAHLPPLRKALVEASKATGYTPDEIINGSRRKPLSVIRWWVMAEGRKAGLSLPQIARFFNMDHSSVLYGLKRLAEIEEAME